MVFGLLHYACLALVVQRPVSTEASSVGFVSMSSARGRARRARIRGRDAVRRGATLDGRRGFQPIRRSGAMTQE